MKIIIVSAAYPLRGGIAQYAAILFKTLQQRGHQVDVFTFRRQYPKILFPGKTQLETNKTESVRIESHPVLDSINPFNWLKVFGLIKKNRPALIIFNYWMPFFAPCYGAIGWLIKKFTKIKILYICHNIIPHERWPGDLFLTKFAFSTVDYFIVQSAIVANELLSLFPEAKYKHIAHPIYYIFGEMMPKEEARKKLQLTTQQVILFFGFVRAYKGLDLLLKAVPLIKPTLDVKLLVVGEFYEDKTKYLDLINHLGIFREVVIYSDFIPNEEVGLFFSAADVVVLPYKSATQSGIVQVAYHFNKPCIVTDVGGLGEVVIDNKTGFVVPPENPDEIAQAVLRFYEKNKEKEFSANIEIEKKKYSWDNIADAIESFI